MTATTDDRGPSDAPVRRLTVLYDQGCPLCRHVRGWLERQWQLVPLDFVPAGSPQAQQRFPALDHARTLREITVVGDAGQLYEGSAAWVVCLWALHGYRAMAHRFSTPSGAQLARGMVLTAAKWREASKASAARSGPRPQPQGSRHPLVPRLPTAPAGSTAPTAPGRPTAQGSVGRPGSPSTPPWGWSSDGAVWQPPRTRTASEPCEGHCTPQSD
ncbi:putative DCC family thiol-disulfide oxidoreductase YuxK [Streptacidiphilus sp. MAP12-16]